MCLTSVSGVTVGLTEEPPISRIGKVADSNTKATTSQLLYPLAHY